ncbi:MAG: ricin-type beta-trefoil lectin domain protein [Mycobacterium sp.]|nr:ricin-type beta-trefoil lectin domain protein [Mycobacterium sp.]
MKRLVSRGVASVAMVAMLAGVAPASASAAAPARSTVVHRAPAVRPGLVLVPVASGAGRTGGASGSGGKLQPMTPPSGGDYTIRLYDQYNYFDYCLDWDTSQGAIHKGTRVQLYRCNGQQNQVWFWSPDSYEIAATGVEGAWCLDADTNHPADGTPIQMWDCINGTTVNQRWSWNDNAAYPNAIQSHWTGKCLDANVDSTFTGPSASVALWGCVGITKVNQQWVPIAPYST